MIQILGPLIQKRALSIDPGKITFSLRYQCICELRLTSIQ